jgi:cobalt-precorrin-5B (C1)-methyltransferase
MEQGGVRRLLALSGVKTISKLKPFWENHDCLFRVLNRAESIDLACRQGFPKERLLYYQDTDDEEAVIFNSAADAILTKESGRSGGFQEKVEAARRLGVKVYAVKRPVLPLANSQTKCDGPHGLRRQIELLLPGFYQLRTGFTTGSCATAASKAALIALLEQREVKEIDFSLPDGETMSMAISSCVWSDECASASVVKDAGDDPDVTNGIVIESEVRLSDTPGVHFLQGDGVGHVTLPGLGIEVGEPAINPIPRKMIASELSKLYNGGIDVTISVPNGKDIASRTLNFKVGVVDGISILGTSGIVRPLSSDAYIESIAREIDVCKAVGANVLVLNSGAKSERAVKRVCGELCDQSFVHYGNFIGEALRLAYEKGIREVRLGLMIGKAVKLAEGHLDTHSHKVAMNKDFLCSVAKNAGCASSVCTSIMSMPFARKLWLLLPKHDAELFFPKLFELCLLHCRKVYPHGKITLMLVSEDGALPYSLMSE